MKLSVGEKSIYSKFSVLFFAACAGMTGLKASFVDGVFMVYLVFISAWVAYEEGISDVVRDTLRGKVKYIISKE